MTDILERVGYTGEQSIEPSSISGLLAWYKADAITGLSDGQAVDSWADSSGNGYTATSTLTARPLYKTNSLNGKPALLFDGSDDQLDIGTTVPGSTVTAFIVGNKTAASSGFNTMLRTDQLQALSRGTGGDQWGIWEGNEQFYGSALDTTYRIMSFVQRAFNDVDLVQNGTLVNKVGGASLPVAAASFIGSAGGSQYHTGNIAEVIVFNSALSAANRQTVEQYLSGKYGIGVA